MLDNQGFFYTRVKIFMFSLLSTEISEIKEKAQLL